MKLVVSFNCLSIVTVLFLFLMITALVVALKEVSLPESALFLKILVVPLEILLAH